MSGSVTLPRACGSINIAVATVRRTPKRMRRLLPAKVLLFTTPTRYMHKPEHPSSAPRAVEPDLSVLPLWRCMMDVDEKGLSLPCIVLA